MTKQKSIFKTWYFWTFVFLFIFRAPQLDHYLFSPYNLGIFVGIFIFPYGFSHIIRFGISKFKLEDKDDKKINTD